LTNVKYLVNWFLNSFIAQGNHMAGILRISDAASLALHVMVILAENPGTLVSARTAAEKLFVSEAHLSKVLQRLGREKLVISTRGPGGGFKLARPADEISLLEVYETIDGKLRDNECLLHNKACNRKTCILGGMMESIHEQVRGYFTKTSLRQIAEKERLAR